MRSLVATVILLLLSGCFGAGHAGRITGDEGLEAACAGACTEYRSDGTGCAKFAKGTSETCATYFDNLCKSAPGQCVKKK